MRKQIKELQSEVEDLKEEYRYERKQRIKAEKELREWKGVSLLAYRSFFVFIVW